MHLIHRRFFSGCNVQLNSGADNRAFGVLFWRERTNFPLIQSTYGTRGERKLSGDFLVAFLPFDSPNIRDRLIDRDEHGTNEGGNEAKADTINNVKFVNPLVKEDEPWTRSYGGIACRGR